MRSISVPCASSTRSQDFLEALRALRLMAARVIPNALLFGAFCVVWAVVFALALR